MDSNKKSSKKMFGKAWKYKESFFISAVLLVLGFVIEYLNGASAIQVPSFPTNLSISLAFVGFLIMLYVLDRDTILVQWMSSVPAAIASIVHVTILGIMLGLIPQVEKAPENPDFWYIIGLTDQTSSWHYALGYLFFLSTLGMATVKMFFSGRILQRLGTILSHIGLFITVLAATAGSGDLKRYYFILEDGKAPVNKVIDQKDSIRTMPFALQLDEFDIKEYHPKIVLADRSADGKTQTYRQNNNRFYVCKEGASGTFKDYTLRTDTFLQYSLPHDSTMQSYGEYKKNPALPSAYVSVFKDDKNITSGWISSGNYRLPRKNLWLNDSLFFAMYPPEAKEYSSDITAYGPEGQEASFTLRVNETKKFMGWKLYQTGYNEELGKWSNYSIIEAGHDPWLPAVYTGIFIMIAGAIYIFWKGQTFRKEELELENESEPALAETEKKE